MTEPNAPRGVDVSLPGVGRCLRVHDAPDVLSALARVMPGWRFTTRPAAGSSPELYVHRDGDGLWQSDPGTGEEFHLPSSASAACSLVAELLCLRLGQDPELVGLHCGSVEVGGRLVLFPQARRAGKSTLTTAFAAAGYRVFGDDVLGLDAEGNGVAMGVAPRLRLPLPASFAPELTGYAARHAGPEDDRYRFVLPPGGGLAASGDKSPLGALVLLERSDGPLTPEVLALSPGEGLLQLLCQNFAHETTPEALMARFLPLMQRLPCLLLRYGEPLAGARCLVRVLKGELSPANTAAAETRGRKSEPPPATPDDAARLWRPAPAVNTYPLGDELFLIHTPSGTIHRLNSTGRLVWQLLGEEPLSVAELGALLAEFYQAGAVEVTRDVAALMHELAGADLVVSRVGS